jgi:hypothetical protein
LKLSRAQGTDQTRGIRGAVERSVVAHDRNAVRGQANVELQPIGTRRNSQVEDGKRVLRSESTAAAMREHTGTREPVEMLNAQCVMLNVNAKCSRPSLCISHRVPWALDIAIEHWALSIAH